MTSLDFLYIALGGGFMLLVIFLCVTLLHLTLVLRDVTKITANAKDISDRVREAVLEPLKVLSELGGSFAFINDFVEKIKTRYSEETEGEDVEEKKDKGGFAVKKLRK
ncbi:hypothetical protein IT412_00930 [Candidatus Peregrinibacteria bacterium]|nr:hypothetical protein [Candidatus Peregrinibacteria bacterium]